ncbi:MAG TPA: hypothetical protein PLS50_02515 [Candidatus Dojkabacteria bacterium]|nr:hypothetical protein [Candidatus Dojkabacteria bacterium]
MTEYYKINIGISKKQQKSIADAVSSGSSVRLKLNNKQLYGSNASFLATKTQALQIEKAKKNAKGVMITLSKTQLQKMKEGGFLPVLLGSLVASLAPVLFNRLFPDKRGEGIHLPGSGIEDGQYINPANGDNTNYNIEGFNANNAGIGAGEGIVIPGSTTARRYVRSVKPLHPIGQGLGKKKKMNGMGFIAPNSESFQELL